MAQQNPTTKVHLYTRSVEMMQTALSLRIDHCLDDLKIIKDDYQFNVSADGAWGAKKRFSFHAIRTMLDAMEELYKPDQESPFGKLNAPQLIQCIKAISMYETPDAELKLKVTDLLFECLVIVFGMASKE